MSIISVPLWGAVMMIKVNELILTRDATILGLKLNRMLYHWTELWEKGIVAFLLHVSVKSVDVFIVKQQYSGPLLYRGSPFKVSRCFANFFWNKSANIFYRALCSESWLAVDFINPYSISCSECVLFDKSHKSSFAIISLFLFNNIGILFFFFLFN